MAEPFQTEPVVDVGMVSRWLGSGARAAAARDLEVLLAAAERIADVSPEEVHAAAALHGVDLVRHMRAASRSLYRRYLEHCFVDRKLRDHEAAELAHLRAILRLDEADCAKTHHEVARALFGAAVNEALGDLRLEPEEEAFLDRLRRDLRLEKDAADRELQEGTRKARARFLASASAGEGALVAAREATVELTGSSPESIEAAVRVALEQAGDVLPEIERVDLVRTGAQVVAGKATAWEVTLRAILPRPS
jgi:flavin-binding protein dodecin